ncbi:MAG: S16 family serine protease, partial [Myxococcaceae bacterium]
AVGSPVVCGGLAARVRQGHYRRIGALGWTPVGGLVSPLEAVAVQGRGELFFSGNVKGTGLDAGRVSYHCLKAKAQALGIEAAVRERDLHLNFTDSDWGKDGLSSGLALALAGLAAFSGRRVRARLGATGVLTLSGEVQQVGGIHEKLTAAHLDGIRRVLLPRANRADAERLPSRVRRELELVFVASLDDALAPALLEENP